MLQERFAKVGPAPPGQSKRDAADRAVRLAVNTWVWRITAKAAKDKRLQAAYKRTEPGKTWFNFVNRESEQLVRAIRAAIREVVREQPGRAQAGEVDRVMRAVAPKVGKVLRA